MNKLPKGPPPKDVDDYLAAVPQPARKTLEKLRQIIKTIAPEAEEVISYQIPAYKYHGMLVGFAAFKEHCGFYLMSNTILKFFKEELSGFETATGTIRFPPGKPLPVTLVKKLVRARVAENEANHQIRINEGKKRTVRKPGDADKVQAFMDALEHPLKAEIDLLRGIIKKAEPKLSERIKWNAPSYYYRVDLLTFNPRLQEKVHLIFHNEAIVKITSTLLEGDYKDRRMMYFSNIKEIAAHKIELESILREYTRLVDQA